MVARSTPPATAFYDPIRLGTDDLIVLTVPIAYLAEKPPIRFVEEQSLFTLEPLFDGAFTFGRRQVFLPLANVGGQRLEHAETFLRGAGHIAEEHD